MKETLHIKVNRLEEGLNEFHYSSDKVGELKAVVDHLGQQNLPLSTLKAEIGITKVSGDYVLAAHLESKAELGCHRCRESFSYPIDHRFQLALIGGKESDSEAGEVAATESADCILFNGTEIDLGPIIEEQLLLSLPYQWLCSEICQGLCQYCGQNLNTRLCQCKEERDSNAFSILGQLKH